MAGQMNEITKMVPRKSVDGKEQSKAQREGK